MGAATAALDLTTTLTAEMMLYYETKFLERAQSEQVYSFLTEGSRTSIPKNGGKSVAFTRQTAYTPSTGGLTEGGMKVLAFLKSTLNKLGSLKDLTYMGSMLYC
jgi:hypothetical protein